MNLPKRRDFYEYMNKERYERLKVLQKAQVMTNKSTIKRPEPKRA